jgi:hypothetical protein
MARPLTDDLDGLRVDARRLLDHLVAQKWQATDSQIVLLAELRATARNCRMRLEDSENLLTLCEQTYQLESHGTKR